MGWVPVGWLLFVGLSKYCDRSWLGDVSRHTEVCGPYIPTNCMSHLEREFLPWPKDLRLGEPPILDTHGPGSLKDANCYCRKERDSKEMHHIKKQKLYTRGPAGARTTLYLNRTPVFFWTHRSCVLFPGPRQVHYTGFHCVPKTSRRANPTRTQHV